MQIGLVALIDISSYNYARKLQLKLYEQVDVIEELKLEPHITIKYAIEVDNLEKIEKYFDELVAQTERFEVQIKGINYFESGVVFLDIVKNNLLSNLHLKILNDLAAKYSIKPSEFEGENFNFHITLAKDLDLEKFKLIKEGLKTENPNFKIKITQLAMYLLPNQNANWFIYKAGKLK